MRIDKIEFLGKSGPYELVRVWTDGPGHKDSHGEPEIQRVSAIRLPTGDDMDSRREYFAGIASRAIYGALAVPAFQEPQFEQAWGVQFHARGAA